MARAGNPVGLGIIWPRVFPVRAGAPVEFDMPPVLTADDVAPASMRFCKLSRIRN
jgi:hypothetical protein